MATAAELAPRFHDLFAGMDGAYGTYGAIGPDHTRSDGKLKGQAYTVRKRVTDDLWEQHLLGQNGLGIIPIREDNTACFGAIDIDVYSGLDPVAIAAKLKELELPLIVCRSKSGGVHIYLFSRVPVPARKMVEKLQDVAAKLGYGNAEIFPKQVHLPDPDKDLGAWINAPFFQQNNTDRYAIRADGAKLNAEEFLQYAEECKVSEDFFPDPENAPGTGKRKPKTEQSEGEKLLPDGPPCLQYLIETGIGEGGRNNVLFNIGIYYRKSRATDFIQHIETANRKFIDPPLASAEVNAIISTHNKKSYGYTCDDPNLKPFCNRAKCNLRKYGVGGGSNSFPRILGLRKLLTDPPVWFLELEDPRNGTPRVIELILEELVDPSKFQLKCGNYLDILPIMPSKIVWQHQVSELIANVQHMEAPPPESASLEGQFWDLVDEFLTDRAQATKREEIKLGMPYTEKELMTGEMRTYFRSKDLLQFLGRKQFKHYQIQQITKVLRKNKERDARHVTWHIPNCTQLWHMPAIERLPENFDVPEAVTNDGQESNKF